MAEPEEPKPQYKVVNLQKVPLDLYKQVKALAKARGQTLTWIVVQALKEYVKLTTTGPPPEVPGASLRQAYDKLFAEIQEERYRAWTDTPKEVVLGMVKNLESYLNAVK